MASEDLWHETKSEQLEWSMENALKNWLIIGKKTHLINETFLLRKPIYRNVRNVTPAEIKRERENWICPWSFLLINRKIKMLVEKLNEKMERSSWDQKHASGGADFPSRGTLYVISGGKMSASPLVTSDLRPSRDTEMKTSQTRGGHCST